MLQPQDLRVGLAVAGNWHIWVEMNMLHLFNFLARTTVGARKLRFSSIASLTVNVWTLLLNAQHHTG